MGSSYRDLEAWQLAVTLVEHVYRVTDAYPAAERFGMVSQTRRAAVSVPANIAEGQTRPRGAFLNHLTTAMGSIAELETLLILAERLHYLDTAPARQSLALAARVDQCVRALRRALSRDR